MKVSELFEAAKYDNSTKKLSGTTKEWMAAIGATKEDVAKAYQDAKDLPSYDALLDIVTDISSASQAKNGTFKFNRLEGVKGSYEIYANGQIRVTGMNDGAGWDAPEGTEIPYQTKLASPKPRLKHGDVNASLKMIYDRAFKEMTKKLLKIKKAAEKEKLAEAKAPGATSDATYLKFLKFMMTYAVKKDEIPKLSIMVRGSKMKMTGMGMEVYTNPKQIKDMGYDFTMDEFKAFLEKNGVKAGKNKKVVSTPSMYD